jgi:hypothetical protein
MTMTDRSTVVGVFELRSEADAAIYELQRAGFRDDQIGFIVRNEDAGTATTVEDGNTTEGAPGATVGAVSGGIIGGVIGAAAALLIPGIGPAIAGGILVTVLGGAAIGAAAGGIVGALVSMGVPEEEAHYYSGEFHSGRTLVTVKAEGRQQEAINILHHNGGYDAGTRSGQAPASTQVDQVAVASSPGTSNSNTRADQMFEPPSSTGTSTNTSPRHYDTVAGVTQKGNQGAPVASSEYGLQRDPTVETDATAGTIDTNVRPDTPLESRSKDSLFEPAAEEGTVEPGLPSNSDDQLPRNL